MRARRRPLNAEGGSGSILAVAILGASMLLTALVVPLLALLAIGQSVQNAADAAALAAADTASGAVAGFPCTTAETAATLNAASVSSCSIDGLIATVTVRRTAAGFDFSSRSRAGPPSTKTTGPAPSGQVPQGSDTGER